MKKYIRLNKGLIDKGILIEPEKLYNYIDDFDQDWYMSIYYYNEQHYEIFKKINTIRGITDTFTDKIFFDFDHKTNLEEARKDAIELINRLKKYNITDKNIEIYFSGNKGFHISITVDRLLTPEKVNLLAIHKYGYNLLTLDKNIYNPSRIIRVPGTKHPKTNLYKIPLSEQEFKTLSFDEIKNKASSLDNIKENFEWEIANPNEDFFETENIKNKLDNKQDISNDLKEALKIIPKGWKDYKYALLQGFFNEGERHNALMVLAATCRGLGYSKEDTYYLCKSALKKQAARSKMPEFDKEELWDNIIQKSVFGPNWQGGQYSPENNEWLRSYCERYGFEYSKTEKNITFSVDETFNIFNDYAENIDAYTIKTGIPSLDEKIRMTIGMSVGIVAPPASGKSSLVLQILNNLSKMGEPSIFFSYDMYSSLVYQKLIQNVTGLDGNQIFKKFKLKDTYFIEEVKRKIKEEYGNVEFCFEVGQTINDIQETINNVEEKIGKKIRFIAIDYGELIITDISDPTNSSSFVAQNIRALAITNNLCVLTLYQPNKLSGGPDQPIKSYNSAKGSGAISASVSIMLGMYRPGYNPENPENDTFATIVCLKNRMGNLFSLDYYWDGVRGIIRDMTEEEKEKLKEIREKNKENIEDW